jgi:conjugative relaxase-like TrwC/TraI family protein
MLSVTPSTDAQQAKDYFTRHMDRDYYLRDAAEFRGQWHGRGAELLGLSGQVDKESYFRLCENINPKTGERLTPHTRAARRVSYDFTFNAPKSVTLAYELGGDERVETAFRESVKETMAEMENAMRARVRTDGKREDRATCNMVFAEFIHRTTRPVDGMPDPHLHIHAVALNATYDPVEKRWKAGEFERLVRDKGYYQAAFHSHLASKMAALGYGIERDGNSFFRLAGIDRATCDEFSRRTELIEAEAKRLRITDAKTKGKLGRWTREAKPEEQMNIRELRDAWRERLGDAGRKQIIEARAGQETTALNAGQAVDYAVSHCFERDSTVTQKNLLKTALIQSFGKASVEDVRAAALRDDILQKERGGHRYVTTREVLKEECDITNFVRLGLATRDKLGGLGPIELDPNLSEEQRNAALVILNSRDRTVALKGGAGTGKTTMMRSTIAAIEKTGKQVFTFAPSAEASRGVLRSEGFQNAETVERLLIDPKMQKEVNGQVLWIDEAGLLSVKDMKRLFDVAKEQNARVILSGDSAQNNAVLRGDALRILEKDSGLRFGVLKQIRRQTNEHYRNAVAAIAEGDTLGRDGRTCLEAGIAALDNIGAIIEANSENRYRQIAEDYAAITSEREHGGGFKSALVVSPTHNEAALVTDAIRETLKQSGKLSSKEREFTALRSRNLTEAERTIAGNYSPGEIVQFHQNAKRFKRGERVTVADAGAGSVTVKRSNGGTAVLPFSEVKKFQLYHPENLAVSEGDKLRITTNGFTRETRRGLLGRNGKDRLNNGAVYEVEGFTKAGDIKLTNGFVVPKDYGGLAHGYVVTSHASQGKTVDRVLIALGSESLAAANRENFYVSVSRGREGVRLYTDDKAAMIDAVQGSSARLSASELMRDVPVAPKQKPGMVDRLFKAQHSKRAYDRLRERIAGYDFIEAFKKQQQKGRLSYGRH